ncbi:MAG: hypothetical protein EPO08_20345 [Rhodospirillaceae bacterium]|nr:MAG: hypothetical protein EPO08_20345 [Rhodospirillaceae bacterium]
MPISADEAATDLRDIAQIEARSRELKGYEKGSPYLLLWGTIWIIGYTAGGLGHFAGSNWWLWPLVDMLGIGGSVIIALRQARTGTRAEGNAHRNYGLRSVAGCIVAMCFTVATYTVLAPHFIKQFIAFPGLLLGTIYALIGVIWLPRYFVLGAIIFVLTLVGFFWVETWLSFWMAAVGGGGLILGGLWLRKA